MPRLRKLVRLTSIYTLGKVTVAVLGFLLLPLYTRALTPAEYGIIGLALLAGNGVQKLFSLGLDAAAFNFYHRYDGAERESFYSTLFLFLLVLGVAILVVIEVFGRPVFALALGRDTYDPYIRIV